MMARRRSHLRPWSALAVALFFTLLTHDLLMAAAPAGQSAHPGHHPPSGAIGAFAADTGSSPGHPVACGVSQPAAPRIWTDDGGADEAAPSGVWIGLAPLRVAWRTPTASHATWPPGIRRALLQVYRI